MTILKEEWYVVPVRRALEKEGTPRTRTPGGAEIEIEEILLVLTPNSERGRGHGGRRER